MVNVDFNRTSVVGLLLEGNSQERRILVGSKREPFGLGEEVVAFGDTGRAAGSRQVVPGRHGQFVFSPVNFATSATVPMATIFKKESTCDSRARSRNSA